MSSNAEFDQQLKEYGDLLRGVLVVATSFEKAQEEVWEERCKLLGNNKEAGDSRLNQLWALEIELKAEFQQQQNSQPKAKHATSSGEQNS